MSDSKNSFQRWHNFIALWIAEIGVLAVLGVLIEVCLAAPRVASAQGVNVITHTAVSDWNAGCAGITNTVVANADGGELRLAATVEDYFDGTMIDVTRWYSEVSNPAAGNTNLPTVSGGLLTLDGNYVRSIITLTQLPRVFETRARLMQAADTSSNPDIGFFRERGPLRNPNTTTSSIRLFVLADAPTNLYVRSRNNSDSIVDVDIVDPDTTQFQTYRIEWDSTETRYYINNVLQTSSLVNTTVVTSWVFLYSQDPGSPFPYGATPMTVDWVRGGQYPASGTYVSCALDGAGPNWLEMYWNATVPSNTNLAMRTRASPDGINWGSWSAPTTTNPFSITTNARFLQYMVEMSTTNPMFSPEVQSISVTRRVGPSTVRLTTIRAYSQGPTDWLWLGMILAGTSLMGVCGLWLLRRRGTVQQ